MNKKPLNAAYEAMSGKELAAVAYAYAGNELESLRIKAAVPHKIYSMLDAQFVDALYRIHLMALVWTADYWKGNFLFAAESAIAFNAMNKGDYQKADSYFESLGRTRQVMSAHQVALKEVCSNHGIDYKVLLAKSGIAEIDCEAVGIDLEYKANLIEGLEALLKIE